MSSIKTHYDVITDKHLVVHLTKRYGKTVFLNPKKLRI